MPSTRSATRPWFWAVSTPITAHCSAVDSSMLRKLVTAVMAQGYAGNPARRLLRHRAMRIPTTLVAGLLALAAPRRRRAATTTPPSTAGDDQAAAEPTASADCDDCRPCRPRRRPRRHDHERRRRSCRSPRTARPPEDLDPDDAVSSDDPPVCTPEDNDVVGTILVEEDPDEPDGGRKISFTVTDDTMISAATADGT